jgi:ABC-type proline/glycine betaine transport system permease subunit
VRPTCSSLGNAQALPETARAVTLLFVFAPLFLAFELWQLVVAERYVGLKQIERGMDPRELGLGEVTAAFWSLALLAYWAWMVLMLFQPWGRLQLLMLIGVSGLGFMIRRGCGLKWVLVVLTFEGAVRIGMLLSLCVLVWRRLL